jgi:nitrate/nitrite-specific signal transduction histidine kinase
VSERETAAAKAPSAAAAEPQRSEALATELRLALERVGELIHGLRQTDGVPPPAQDPGAEKLSRLKQRLEAAEAELTELSDRLVETEHQRGRLMNLYVATYQLHATLDLDEVEATIGEIARDLLGAERFLLLLKEDDAGDCEVALQQGLDQVSGALYTNGRYTGGDLMVDQTLADGVLRMGQVETSQALAVVPLTVQGLTVGAIVILKLFDHKPSLTAEDRDLLDLLAAHAASALFAARVYSTTDRKLRTLEGLLQLVRGI